MSHNTFTNFRNYDDEITTFESLEFPELGSINVTYEVLPETLVSDPHVVIAFDFDPEKLILRDKATGNLYRLHEVKP